jgi:predicted aspartyl protease
MFLAVCAIGLAISPARLEIRGDYPILHDVYVNGKGPLRMLLDTGAQSTSVSPDAAKRAGLRPTFAVEVQRVQGPSIAPVTQARTVASGGLAVEEVEVLITEPPAAAVIGPLDGVIGQSFLSRTNYWVDYGRREIRWDPQGELAACLEGERLDFELVEGRPAMRGQVAGEPRRLVLDTGASHLILFGGSAPASRVTMTRVEQLTLGGLRWRGLTAGVLPATEREGGLLPGHLLKSFYVNNRERYALVGPRVSGPRASVPAGPLARRAEATDREW